MENNKSASQILNEAADLLEREDRWGKGTYFQENKSNPEKGCLMCAHGAIAYCGNKEVRDKVIFGNLNAVRLAVADLLLGVVADAALALPARSTPEKNFNYYNNLYKTRYPHLHQLFLAHYKAMMVGLTYRYNDTFSTTKQDVINKLREATIMQSDQ